MADHKSIFSALFFLILSLSFKSSHGADIAIYWGQNGNEGSLADACDTSNYKYVNIAFLSSFGNGQMPKLNLAGHCDPSSYGSCAFLSTQIMKCQDQGVKVLLSIGGDIGFHMLNSEDDAKEVANYIWNNFLGGQSDSRPLGYAVLDGVDFDIESGGTQYWDVLAKALKEYSDQVVLAAAPQCAFPDNYLDSAIETGVFDHVWVKFYDNPSCQYSNGNLEGSLLRSWKEWSEVKAGSIFVGLPASPSASSMGGYIPSEEFISEVLPALQSSPKFGGVMLWNRYYDLDSKYSDEIKPSLDKEEVHQKAIAFE